MTEVRARMGMLAGGIAAATTGGALLRIGLRGGDAALPFNAIAGYALGAITSSPRFHAAVTVVGVVIHLMVLTTAGLAAESLSARWRLGVPLSAVIVSSALLSLSLATARFAGAGLAAALPVGDLIVIHIAIALGLVGGMGFARFIQRDPGGGGSDRM